MQGWETVLHLDIYMKTLAKQLLKQSLQMEEIKKKKKKAMQASSNYLVATGNN